jgi:beta-galactosidase
MNRLLNVRIVLLSLALFSTGCISRSPRTDYTLDHGWRFIRQDVPNAQSLHFSDSHWQSVTLPHTWNNLDGQDGGGNYYRGPGWYRKHFSISSWQKGKSYFLRFEAASLVADVYVNGQHVGQHKGGFSAFCFDVTNVVHAGDNLLAVRVDNARDPAVPPQSGDFTICGGLYRDVHLLVLNPVSINPLDDASPGVYLVQKRISQNSAQIHLITKLRNIYATDQSAQVRCTIKDADQNQVTQTFSNVTIPANGTADALADISINQPHLWNGVTDPYLYYATIDVLHNDKVVDRIVQPLGLRYYSVDPNNGFALNDGHYWLHGVDVHQDFYNRGWAITPKQIDQNYRLIREMGVTAVRLAHYQHPDYEYSVCDRLGIVVWAEVALVNRINDTPDFSDDTKQQLRELIKQNFNHPSICFWSLYNELGFRGPRNIERWKLVAELNDLAHQLDGTRLTTAATMQDADHPINWIMDITGFNRYFGWYKETLDSWPTALDAIHAAYPNRAIAVSEYGAGASVHQHEVYPTTHPNTEGWWHPEEWQGIFHEHAYAAMQDRHWLWGTFAWCMFDFASDGRKEGDQPGRNDKGLVTADRKIRKDAFYFYKANWNDDPFVYITSKRFNPRPPGATTLKVYSNCGVVELFLNGQSLGRKTGVDHVFTWPNVNLPEGKCIVRAVGQQDERTYKDGVKWKISKNAPTTMPSEQ